MKQVIDTAIGKMQVNTNNPRFGKMVEKASKAIEDKKKVVKCLEPFSTTEFFQLKHLMDQRKMWAETYDKEPSAKIIEQIDFLNSEISKFLGL